MRIKAYGSGANRATGRTGKSRGICGKTEISTDIPRRFRSGILTYVPKPDEWSVNAVTNIRISQLARLLFLGLLIASFAATAAQAATAPVSKDMSCETVQCIDSKTFSDMIRSGTPKPVVIDTRKPKEFQESRLAGAVNIDLLMGPDMIEEALEGYDRDGIYLLYCLDGDRSGKFGKIMLEIGFQNVYNLQGGLIEWQDLEYPVEK